MFLVNNLFYLQGWAGHPDGNQDNGGNFAGGLIAWNTYYNPSGQQGLPGASQPFHVEAQLTAAITNATVAYNTMLTPGTCKGGRNFPTGCAVNFDIACKNDAGWVDSNKGFAAYGNYIDWSGAIAGLSNAYKCTSTTWGAPVPNIDLSTGKAL